jgi:hypothetical protein
VIGSFDTHALDIGSVEVNGHVVKVRAIDLGFDNDIA